jgi:hypothetical protein
MNYPLNARFIAGRIVSAALSYDNSRTASVVIRNDSEMPLSGTGKYPISIGMHLLDSTGSVIDSDWLHFPLPCPINPGEERTVIVILPDSPVEAWSARVDLVQEGVSWFKDWGGQEVLLSVEPGDDR